MLKENNKFAKNVHSTWEFYLLSGLISLVNIFDPESIIISGGMKELVDFERFNKELNELSLLKNTRVFPAKSGNDAGIIGAAILAEEKFSYNLIG